MEGNVKKETLYYFFFVCLFVCFTVHAHSSMIEMKNGVLKNSASMYKRERERDREKGIEEKQRQLQQQMQASVRQNFIDVYIVHITLIFACIHVSR